MGAPFDLRIYVAVTSPYPWDRGVTPAKCLAEVTSPLFLKHVVKYWGLPKTIVSDRDGRFTGRFWTELFKLMGSDLNSPLAFILIWMARQSG